MPRGSGYPVRLTLTREMRVALTKLTAREGSPQDFPLALKALRLGFLLYDVLTVADLHAMFTRGLMGDDEVQFLLEKGFIEHDFRPVKTEAIHQAAERKYLNRQFRAVMDSWDDSLKESSKKVWLARARKYVDLPNARKLVELVSAKKEVKVNE